MKNNKFRKKIINYEKIHKYSVSIGISMCVLNNYFLYNKFMLVILEKISCLFPLDLSTIEKG